MKAPVFVESRPGVIPPREQHSEIRMHPEITPAARAALLASACAAILASASASAAEAAADSQAAASDSVVLEPVVIVVGERIQLDTIPGSAFVLDQSVLEQSRVFTVNEALRQVPGVFARDEEGFGLRPNFGIRGLNPTR